MTIQEMHNEFRTFGQVMGLQLVRGILPESIDVYLNAAINETVRNIISKNVANSLQVGILPQAASITPINALRTLYRVHHTDITESNYFNDNPFELIVDFHNVLLYTDFYIDYKNGKKDVHCRLIEPDRLSDALTDYCTRPTINEPIVTMFTEVAENYLTVLKVMTGQTESDDKKVINGIKICYINNPKIVKYNVEGQNEGVDCDLPEYLHEEIVQLAVKKYIASISPTMSQQKN